MGLRRKIQQDLLGSGLPDDLMAEFHRLSEWVHTLPAKFGDGVRVRLVDAASLEGFFKSAWRRFHRYPAFTVAGERYVGWDLASVEALISLALGRPGEPASLDQGRVQKGG
jgi:hypothetical protein